MFPSYLPVKAPDPGAYHFNFLGHNQKCLTPKDKYAIWEVVFKRLYQYLIGEQGVTRLIRNRNYEEFIGYLEQG